MLTVAADRLPSIRDVLADFREAATDEATRRQRRLAEAAQAVSDAARYNATTDMQPVVAAVAACDDTPSLIRVAGALLQAIAAKGWTSDNANQTWGALQDVIGDLEGLCEREADEAELQRLSYDHSGGCEFDEVGA